MINLKQDELFICIDMIKDKYKILILSEMEMKREFKELMHAVSSIDKQELINQLQELIALGVITRIVNVNKKPMVIEYALTNRGAMLLKCIKKMKQIGKDIKQDFCIKDI